MTFLVENCAFHLLGDGEGLVDEGRDSGIRVKSDNGSRFRMGTP